MTVDRVEDDEPLYRSVSYDKDRGHFCERDGKVKFSSQAFTDRSLKPSLDRAKLRSKPEDARLHPNDGIVTLVAGDIRGISGVIHNASKVDLVRYVIDVIPDPLKATEGRSANPAHALVVGTPELNKKVFWRLLEALAAMADKAGWTVPPTS